MSTRSIAVAGAGRLGTYIIRGLLNTPSRPKLVVLTRSKSNSLPADLSSIVTTIPVDYTDVSALTTVLKDHSIDIIVSTLPDVPGAMKAQYALANAAKASGIVKLLVPSEWSIPTEGAKAKGETNLFAAKDEFADYLRSIQIPFTRIYPGIFIEWLPWATGMDVNDNVSIVGKGETLFSATSEVDTAGFTAHILVNLPLDSPHLVNQSLRLEGDRITIRDVARIFEKPMLSVDQVPGDEEGHPRTFTQKEVEAGRVSTGWNRLTDTDEGTAGSANKLWEGHVWEKVKKTEKSKEM